MIGDPVEFPITSGDGGDTYVYYVATDQDGVVTDGDDACIFVTVNGATMAHTGLLTL